MKPEAAEDPEAVWLRDVYQPNAVNLTVRAVIGGMLIGGVMCVSNIYVFLKTGWSMGVTITACILDSPRSRSCTASPARDAAIASSASSRTTR